MIRQKEIRITKSSMKEECKKYKLNDWNDLFQSPVKIGKPMGSEELTRV